MNKKHPMKLQSKLMFSIVVVLIMSISISSYFISEFEVDKVEQKTEKNLKNISTLIANSSIIQKELFLKNTNKIQQLVESYLIKLEDIEIITIADMNGIRFGHPNRDRLGDYFVGGDEKKVLEEAKTYSSVAIGTLGRSIRVFVPIFYENKQVGFVMTAHKYDKVEESINNIRRSILVYAFFGIIIGGIGAILISISIKKSLLYLEPYEIAKLYREKDIILKSTREGIMAVDLNGNINLMNDSAKKILNCEHNNLIGMNILEVFPTTKLIRILHTGEAEYNREQLINNSRILTNRIPIYENEKLIGALATFKDLSEVVELAEEITGVRQIVKSLRATTHEFMNKLHLIHGLVELEEYDETKVYIRSLGLRYTKIQETISNKIKNPTINALIIGKINRASEEQINLEITSDTLLLCEGYNLNTGSMVIILGNLIENAIEAIKKTKRKDGVITVYLNDLNENIIIEVSDNGIGIELESINQIFKRGFTTKNGSNGIGLDLVNANVKRLNGEITVSSKYEIGTTIAINIPID